MTALGIACWEGQAVCAAYLLDARADVNGKSSTGKVVWTPLMLSCDNGRVACVELLLHSRADPKYKLCIPREKGEPTTALEFAEDGAAAQKGGEDGASAETCASKVREHVHMLELEKQLEKQAWRTRGSTAASDDLEEQLKGKARKDRGKENKAARVTISKELQQGQLLIAIYNVRQALERM